MEKSNLDSKVLVENLGSMDIQALEDKDNVSGISEENEINKSISSKSRMEKMDSRMEKMDSRLDKMECRLDIVDNNLIVLKNEMNAQKLEMRNGFARMERMLETLVQNKNNSEEVQTKLTSDMDICLVKDNNIQDGMLVRELVQEDSNLNIMSDTYNVSINTSTDNIQEIDGNLIFDNMVISEDYTYKEEVLDDMETLDDRSITTDHTYMGSIYNRSYTDGFENKSIIDDYAYKDICMLGKHGCEDILMSTHMYF